MKKEQLQTIQETAEEMLRILGVVGKCVVSEGDSDTALLGIESEDSGMLIGYHGETLEALQLLIALASAKKFGSFVRVSVEIGDYKKNREEWLQQLVAQTKDRVLQEGKPISLPNLKPWERRVVHLMLQDDHEVVSESTGEGRERMLVISPKP